MFCVNQNTIDEYIIKNSRFITCIFKINNIDEVELKLLETKEKYPKATHYCYAYIIDNIKKSSDDGEPGGTAGTPILNVLEKNNLTNILVIVVRYFGGIKLGAGGLVRAYTKAVTDALKKVHLNELIDGLVISLELDYNDLDNFNYLLNNPIIIEKEFLEKINLKVLITFDQKNILDINKYNYKILEEKQIEKK